MKIQSTFLQSLLLFYSVLSFPISCLAVSSQEINSALLKELSNYPQELLGTEWCNVDAKRQELWVSAVYNDLDAQLLWVDDNGPNSKAKIIFSTLKKVGPDGLNPEEYGVVPIESIWESRTAENLAKLDIYISIGLLGYIHDMQEGRIAPNRTDPTLFDQAGCSTFDPVKAMFAARNNSDLEAYLAGLAPAHHYYRTLKQELKHYRNIKDMGGWPLFLTGKTLHPGDFDKRVPVLRRMLVKNGDLISSANLQEQLYDDQLVEAVKRFQSRNGLEVDGVVGKGTTAVLIIPVEQRIQQILMNMERWRWTEHDLGNKYVVVDIAGYNLQGVVNDYTLLEMPVIVGKLQHETPVFSDSIKYVDFNPFWNITPSIAKKEMLAKLREDSNYLASKHIKLFSNWQADGIELDPLSIDWDEVSRKRIGQFKLRQEPGAWNALGIVKFVFPNKYSIYLHDTPGRDLFDKTDRAFSHGCIRVSEPQQLAEFLLAANDIQWTEEAINNIVKSEKRKVVRLKDPIPIHMVYQTAWVDKNGMLHFSEDVYGRDKKLAAALFIEE